ncbi:MAG TPA: tetratricopeptide repeat protein [Planctomycetota bacterium]|nr:tetratricopeptide repeat protein [Planctomycetota bacterium]
MHLALLLHAARSRAFSLLAALLLGACAGCGPSLEDPLPPESDLHAYSVAVVERARRLAVIPGAKAAFYLGRVHERFGSEDRALALYREAIKKDLASGEAFRRIGFILSQRKDQMAAAIEAYEGSLRAEPSHAGVRTRIGLILTHMNRLEEAVRAFRDEARAGTADEETHYNLGQALALLGRHQEAIESYREALKLEPDLRTAHYSLAQSLRAAGDAAGAEEAQKRFIALKAKEDAQAASRPTADDKRTEFLRYASEAWMDAADIFSDEATGAKDAERRRIMEAEFLHALREALRIDPTHLEPRTVLVRYYVNKGDMESGVQVLETALREVPRASALAPLAYELTGKLIDKLPVERVTAAQVELPFRLLLKVTELSPTSADAHRDLAQLILHRMGERKDLQPLALEHALQAVRSDGSSVHYDILAFAHYRNGQLGAALGALEEGLRLHPGAEHLRERLRVFRERVEGPRTP